MTNISSIICLEMDNDNYIIAGESGVYYITNLNNNYDNFNTFKLLNESIGEGIQITSDIVTFASNTVLPYGKDKLIFYNINKKKILKTIENYSFETSPNGMYLMNLNDNNKILLSACKYYLEGQKNGILLVNPDLEDNQDIKEPFYDTEEFEVYCFCQILVFDNKSKLKYTNYFLVGGFDTEKGEGLIKLYRIMLNKRASQTKMEFILDIAIDNNENLEGIERPISCITQSKKNGNIIATCWDGNVYLFTPPNLNYFLR